MEIIKNKNRYQLGGLINQGDIMAPPVRQPRPQMFKWGGPRSRYQIGGIRKNPLHYYRRQAGGMYGDNTAGSVGQGGPGTTSNIVFQESDPKLQEARLQQTQNVIEQQQVEGRAAAASAEQIQEEGKITSEQDALLKAQQVREGFGTAELAGGAIAEAAGIGPAAAKGAAIKRASDAYRIQRSVNLSKKAIDLGKTTAQGMKAAEKAKALLQVGKGAEATTLATGAVEAGSKGSALLAGAKGFLSSGAGLGLLASGAGYGVKKLFADDDPTTADIGDVGGSALSGAGTGMAIGSMILPGIGTGLGAAIGGLYGGIKSVFTAKKAKKAQEKAEREYKEKVRKKVTAYNKEMMEGFGHSLASQRAGELRQKTYSGYDLGRNVVAQMGGMRMGMPRYRYAA